MHRDIRCLVALVFAVFLLSATGQLATAQDPAKIVPKSDVESVLGGTFNVESPEPGVLFYTRTVRGTAASKSMSRKPRAAERPQSAA